MLVNDNSAEYNVSQEKKKLSTMAWQAKKGLSRAAL